MDDGLLVVREEEENKKKNWRGEYGRPATANMTIRSYRYFALQ
jgi:hypothetical protein